MHCWRLIYRYVLRESLHSKFMLSRFQLQPWESVPVRSWPGYSGWMYARFYNYFSVVILQLFSACKPFGNPPLCVLCDVRCFDCAGNPGRLGRASEVPWSPYGIWRLLIFYSGWQKSGELGSWAVLQADTANLLLDFRYDNGTATADSDLSNLS